jgi:hypothetical protein
MVGGDFRPSVRIVLHEPRRSSSGAPRCHPRLRSAPAACPFAGERRCGRPVSRSRRGQCRTVNVRNPARGTVSCCSGRPACLHRRVHECGVVRNEMEVAPGGRQIKSKTPTATRSSCSSPQDNRPYSRTVLRRLRYGRGAAPSARRVPCADEGVTHFCLKFTLRRAGSLSVTRTVARRSPSCG